MIINVTHNGESAEYTLMLDNVDLDDAYIRSLSEELRDLPRGTLQYYVVDRMPVAPGGEARFYVRPKVPFGAIDIAMTQGRAERMQRQLDIAVEALLQYSTSPTSGLRAQAALAEIAALDESAGEEVLS